LLVDMIINFLDILVPSIIENFVVF